MKHIVASNTNGIEILMKIYLNALNHDFVKFRIVSNDEWNKYKIFYLSHDRENATTLLVEILKNRWVTFYIPGYINYKFPKVSCIDPCKDDFPDNINTLINEYEIELIKLNWLKLSQMKISWKYALYNTGEIIKFYPAAVAESLSLNIPSTIEDELSEIKKIKDKIEICQNIFSSILEEKKIIITNFKLALYFTYFLEALALQDMSIRNQNIKRYLTKLIGDDNIVIIKKIRYWIFHRRNSYVLYPEQFHKYIFNEINSMNIFQHLHTYLVNIVNILNGKFGKKVEKEPKEILNYTEQMGNYVEKENIKHILRDFSYDFIKEVFSINKTKNPEKSIFNFIVNFIPLLKVQYGEKVEILIFKSFTDLRNQLVHNIWMLYQKNKELPYILFQNQLQDHKEHLLIFYFCCLISFELNKSPNKLKPNESLARIEICFNCFKEEFKDLYPKQIQTNDLCNEGKVQYLLQLINYYLRIFPLIDKATDLNITNIKIWGFDLPKKLHRFSNIQIRSIFDSFRLLGNIYESNLSELDIKYLTNNIKEDLLDLGLEEYCFNTISESLLKPVNMLNFDLVTNILTHIHTIIKMQKCSKLNITTVIDDYNQMLQRKSPTRNCYKKALRSVKIKNTLFKLKFSSGSFYIDLFTIVKTIIPFYFGIYCDSIIFQNLIQLFNDERILDILVKESFNSNIFYDHVKSVPFLAPLGVKYLCERKLTLIAKDECDLITHCTQMLLHPEFKIEYLNNLFTFKSKNRHFFEINLIETVSNLNLNELYETKKDGMLNFLFLNENFQNKIMKILSDYKYHKDAPKIDLLKCFLNFRFNSARIDFLNKNYKDAFSHVEGKSGLTQILRELENKKITIIDFNFIKKLFLIVQIKIAYGKMNADKSLSRKFYKEGLKDLHEISKSLSSLKKEAKQILTWELKVKNCKAEIHHLLNNHIKSFKSYKSIISDLLGLNQQRRYLQLDENLVDHFKTLMKSPNYTTVIKFFRNFNILMILNMMNTEICHRGNQIKKRKFRNKYFVNALTGFLDAHLIQKKILGIHHNITKFSLFKIGEITLKLRDPIKYYEFYLKSEEVLKMTKKEIFPERSEKKVQLNTYLDEIKELKLRDPIIYYDFYLKSEEVLKTAKKKFFQNRRWKKIQWIKLNIYLRKLMKELNIAECAMSTS